MEGSSSPGSCRELISCRDPNGEVTPDPVSEHDEHEDALLETSTPSRSVAWRHVVIAAATLGMAACACGVLVGRRFASGPIESRNGEELMVLGEEPSLRGLTQPAAATGQLPVTPPTTTWTSTTSLPFRQSSKDIPSLFCWLVSQTVGGEEINRDQGWWEEKLVWEMLMQKVGIFACNEFAVFTDKRALVSEMGQWGWPYVAEDYEPKEGEIVSWALGNTQTARNGDSSPSNNYVFTAAWKALHGSGVLNKHQWVVKQDPDAVVFPWRLRWHASRWQAGQLKDGSVPVFIKNCQTFGSMQGPIEMFSIALVNKMMPGIDNCGNGAAGEDGKMEKCAEQFGGQAFMDSAMLFDKYCMHTPPNCQNGDIAAFHPFKEIPNFRQCVEQSIAEENRFKKAHQPV